MQRDRWSDAFDSRVAQKVKHVRWTTAELLEHVNVPLESPAPSPQERTIAVEGVETDGNALLVEVEVTTPRRQGKQTWSLSFKSMWADVRDLPLASAALTVRANIEEWWDTGAEEDGPGNLVSARRTA